MQSTKLDELQHSQGSSRILGSSNVGEARTEFARVKPPQRRSYPNAGRIWSGEDVKTILKYLEGINPDPSKFNWIDLRPLSEKLGRSPFSIRVQFVLFYKNDPDNIVYEQFPYMKSYYPQWKKEYADLKKTP